MQIVKHYRNDEALRRSFNALAEATFGLNFENWYQNGFWGDAYDPYSVLINGRIVANVSVNRTDMRIGGQLRHLYQLGTVMTAPQYRDRGFIRAIMAEIEKDIGDADGVYLFANDSVLEFYPRFGFEPCREYVYFRNICQSGPCRMTAVPMDSREGWDRLRRAMEESTFRTGCEAVGCQDLIFFYVSQFLQGCVFYDEVLDFWAIAQQEEGELLLHNVFSRQNITLDDVVKAFGSSVKRVTLGFTPEDTADWLCRAHKEDDCTFFVKGPAFWDFEEKNLRIPTLTHA